VIADWVVAVFVTVATVAVAAAVLVRAARPWDLGDVAAGRIAARPVPVADIYAALDEHFRTAAALLQPDADYQPGAWDLADEIEYRRDCGTYRYEYRLPGECAL
jgi:hypothetical protein